MKAAFTKTNAPNRPFSNSIQRRSYVNLAFSHLFRKRSRFKVVISFKHTKYIWKYCVSWLWIVHMTLMGVGQAAKRPKRTNSFCMIWH